MEVMVRLPARQLSEAEFASWVGDHLVPREN